MLSQTCYSCKNIMSSDFHCCPRCGQQCGLPSYAQARPAAVPMAAVGAVIPLVSGQLPSYEAVIAGLIPEKQFTIEVVDILNCLPSLLDLLAVPIKVESSGSMLSASYKFVADGIPVELTLWQEIPPNLGRRPLGQRNLYTQTEGVIFYYNAQFMPNFWDARSQWSNVIRCYAANPQAKMTIIGADAKKLLSGLKRDESVVILPPYTMPLSKEQFEKILEKFAAELILAERDGVIMKKQQHLP